jgi:tetratricopeptide (TPR) repeat protein
MSFRVLCLLCVILLVGSWVSEAIDEQEQALQSAVAWNNKGAIYDKMGEYDKALQAYDNAIQLNPEYAEAWANKGVALYNISEYSEAIQAFNKSISIDPNKAWVWYASGSAYYKLGQYEMAINAYDEAINLNQKENREDANIWADKGYALYNIDKYPEALQAFNKSISIDPNKAWVWNAKGETYASLGYTNEALAAYDMAINLTKNTNTNAKNIDINPEKGNFETRVDKSNPSPVPIKAKISYPLDGFPVPTNEIIASGTVTGELAENQSLWLLVGKKADNQWWPQGGGNITPINEGWEKDARIGEPKDLGLREQMIVILVDEQVNQYLDNWVKDTNAKKDWYSITLPKCKVLAEINVVRSNG